MDREQIDFSLMICIILIITGGVSLLYGFLIPITFLPMNTLPGLIFKISGILFIIIGFILFILQKKASVTLKNKNVEENIHP